MQQRSDGFKQLCLVLNLLCPGIPVPGSSRRPGLISGIMQVEWLQPYTDAKIKDLGASGVKQLLAVPISFVSEHIETLEEIDMEYRELAIESGIKVSGIKSNFCSGARTAGCHASLAKCMHITPLLMPLMEEDGLADVHTTYCCLRMSGRRSVHASDVLYRA